jgi:signal recognition particle subunit SRP54
MFETLYRGFKNARERLTGKAVLEQDNIREALREVRVSLLEADVEFNVVKRFLAAVEAKAVGELVQTRTKVKGKDVAVTAGDHFINICHDELEALMGPVDTTLRMKKGTGVSAIMMVGLQGAGKTTTVGKLAKKLLDEGHRPLLVAADTYRPAAIDQLKVLGDRLGVPVFSVAGHTPPELCQLGLREALYSKHDVVLFDTAGRLSIDEPLMAELAEIKARTKPDEILLVLDSMTGQDAVRTAKTFDEWLDISGCIMTKLDGDARGGAALSVKEVTGKPIKFLGVGEGLDKLEEFRPGGLASRILGFGDIVSLVGDFEKVVDEQKAEEDAKKILSGDFTLVTFLEQIRTLKKMGSLKDVFERMPFMGELSGGMPANVDEGQLKKVEAVILSMTPVERAKPDLLAQVSRLRRIASGSGTTIKDVRELLQRFFGMRRVMKQVGKQPGLLAQLPGFKQLHMLKKLRGAQMDGLLDDLGDLGLGDMPALSGAGPGRSAAGTAQALAASRAEIEGKKKRRDAANAASKQRKKNRR